MLNRRSFCGCASLALFASAVSTSAQAQSAECAVFTPARQKEVSPDEAIERLKAGNARFVSGKTVNCNLMQQVKETAHGQAPFAAVIGCIDSRVPPEMVFDQRIGDVFCARVAANFVNTDILGSVEYATKVVGARAIVVLGHNECGGIKGAIDDVKLGNLTAMLAKIRPAVTATKFEGDRTTKNHAFVQAVAETNARLTAEKLTRDSKVIRELVEAKQLRIAAAMHDIATGKVTFLA
jgi:carbonic anhydrase